jgi:hypothetical protein
LNNLDELGQLEWLFHPGMLFGSGEKWWGDGGKRGLSHEGLDFRTFKTQKAVSCSVNETTRVPVLFDGEIVNVIDDFLGQSVFIRHSYLNADRKKLYTVYGHIITARKTTGEVIKDDVSVGTVAKGKPVPSHLHISVAWVADSLYPQDLNWKTILDTEKVTLIDPLTVIACPYSVVDKKQYRENLS